MANFTINSLSSRTPNSSDTFLKSDANGVLSKTTFADLTNSLITLAKANGAVSGPAFSGLEINKDAINSYTGNHSVTGGSLELQKQQFSIPTGRLALVFVYGAIKMSGGTGGFKVKFGNQTIVTTQTSLTTQFVNSFGVTAVAGDGQVHDISLELYAPSNETATLAQYQTCGLFVVIL